MIMTVLVPILLAAGAPEAPPEKTVVPLTDPLKPVRLKVHQINGSISVTGYGGKEVTVEMKTKEPEKEESEEGQSRYPGMTRLRNRSTGLTVEELDNLVTIKTESWRVPADLVIQVPSRASLELGCVNGGAITVDQIQGDVEAQNVNGTIHLSGISGSALANTTNGNVTASFTALESGKAMSFVTLNGTVDVTLPAGTKANLNLGIQNQGDVYSDFEITTQPVAPTVSESGKRDKSGRYVLKIDRTVHGSINGGGPELTLKTFNGDIVLRSTAKTGKS